MTKFLICSLLVLAPLSGAEKKPAAKSETKKANRAQTATRATGIPAGAVEKSPGSWHYTDAQGKAWIYRQTPFGVARIEDKPAPAPDAETLRRQEAEANLIEAVDEGDKVRFERKSPFGVTKWTKPKTDLNEIERKAWESRRSKTAAAKDKQE